MNIQIIVGTLLAIFIIYSLLNVWLRVRHINLVLTDPFYIYRDALEFIMRGKIPDYPKTKEYGMSSHNPSEWIECPYGCGYKGSQSLYKRVCHGCNTPTGYFFLAQTGSSMDNAIWAWIKPKSKSDGIKKGKKLREIYSNRQLAIYKYAREIRATYDLPNDVRKSKVPKLWFNRYDKIEYSLLTSKAHIIWVLTEWPQINRS